MGITFLRRTTALAQAPPLTLTPSHKHTPAGDLNADPYLNAANNMFVNAGCSSTADTYQALFPTTNVTTAIAAPPATAAASQAVTISVIYYVNREDGNSGRIVSGNGVIQTWMANGTVVSTYAITSSASVSTFVVFTPSPVPTPNPTSLSQTDDLARRSGVRYVRVNAASGQCLNFREIMVRGARGCTCTRFRRAPVVDAERERSGQRVNASTS